MEKQHPINEMMSTTMEKIRSMMDANTIIGDPIQTGEVTLIPVSRLSFGGGSGASAKMEPVAFLIIKGDSVKLLPVDPPPATTVDRVIEVVPEVVEKVTDFLEKQKKADEPPEGTDHFVV